MEKLLSQLLQEVKAIKYGQEKIIKQMDAAEAKLDQLEPIKSQLDENTGIVKALMHRIDELDAKFDGLLTTTATKASIERLEAKAASKEDIDRLAYDTSFLVRKAAEHDDDIRRLRKAE